MAAVLADLPERYSVSVPTCDQQHLPERHSSSNLFAGAAFCRILAVLHTCFQLVPKSTTLECLGDPEQPICTVIAESMRLSEPTTKISNTSSGGSTLGPGGTGPQILPRSPPQIFGHRSSATGWINWFYSKFRLAVIASQMMRGQAPKYFFLEPPLNTSMTQC